MPAPTAWPFVLAFGFTLLFAGLLTKQSVSVLGAVLALAGCVGWFREVFPREHEDNCARGSRGNSRDHRAPRCRTASGRARSGACLASRSDLPDIGRREGRTGGKRRHGRAGLCLRCAENWKHLVSHQSSCCVGLCSIAETRARTAEFISRGQFRDCPGSARCWSPRGGLAVWRDAPDVRAATDRARRTDRPGAVVGAAVHHPRPAESFAGEPHRLVLVYRFPVGFRHCRRLGRGAAVANADARERCLRHARWSGGSRESCHTTEVERGRERISISLRIRGAGRHTALRVAALRPGSRAKGSETLAPNEVLEFSTLYAQNCAGCHGAEGRGGAAIALADPVYLGHRGRSRDAQGHRRTACTAPRCRPSPRALAEC